METEKERLYRDRDEKEQELDYIEDQIRFGHANEEGEEHYINELQNEILYISHLLNDLDD